MQVITGTGGIYSRAEGDLVVPVDARDRAVALRQHPQLMRDTHSGDVHLRVLTVPAQHLHCIDKGTDIAQSDPLRKHGQGLRVGESLGNTKRRDAE